MGLSRIAGELYSLARWMDRHWLNRLELRAIMLFKPLWKRLTGSLAWA